MPSRMSNIPENDFNYTPPSNCSNPSSKSSLLTAQIGSKSNNRVNKKKNNDYEDSSSIYDIDATKVIFICQSINIILIID